MLNRTLGLCLHCIVKLFICYFYNFVIKRLLWQFDSFESLWLFTGSKNEQSEGKPNLVP